MGLLEQHLEKGYPQSKTTRKSRFRQPLPLLCALFLTVILATALYSIHSGNDVELSIPKSFGWPNTQTSSQDAGSGAFPVENEEDAEASDGMEDEESDYEDYDYADDSGYLPDYDDAGSKYLDEIPEYREVFSYTTRDRRFIPLFAEGTGLINPNLIPHPTKHDMWIVIARREQSHAPHDTEEEMACTAGFFQDVLVCEGPPAVIPVAKSIDGQCDGDLANINYHWGPRDMRVFQGPNAPYVVYGSQSQFTCFGVWLQDARMLLDAFLVDSTLTKLFREPTEVRRPGRWKAIEKNFFIFWDSEDKMYVHHDIWPERVYAQLEIDGSVGEDLAPTTAYDDQVCYAKYLPRIAPQEEWIQQATNSLAITLCKRADPGCTPTDSNTFNMHIFHVKSNFDNHLVYEPYVMLFRRTAPFAVYGISQQPLWISGREMLTTESGSVQFEGKTESEIPVGHTERLYITSMTWRTHGQKYHGYIDDVLFLGFGIEDSRAGAIDVLAGDILQDLAVC